MRLRFVPITPIIFVGPFGHGKTLLMVGEALRDPHKKVFVHVTFGLNDELFKSKGFTIVRFSDWKDILKFERGTLLIDEAGLFFSSRERTGLDDDVRAALKQARKKRVRVIYGEQHFGSLAKEMRQYFEMVCLVKRIALPLPGASYRAKAICCDDCGLPPEDRRGDLFFMRTWFLQRWYDAVILEQAPSVHGPGTVVEQKKSGVRFPIVPKKVRFVPFNKSIASFYDTDAVMRVSYV